MIGGEKRNLSNNTAMLRGPAHLFVHTPQSMHMPQPKVILKKRGLRKRGLELYGQRPQNPYFKGVSERFGANIWGAPNADPTTTERPIFGPLRQNSTARARNRTQTFFFSNSSGTTGISQQNPGASRPKCLISLVWRDIPSFLAAAPSRGRPLPHRKISGLKSLGLCSFFAPDVCVVNLLSVVILLRVVIHCWKCGESLHVVLIY